MKLLSTLAAALAVVMAAQAAGPKHWHPEFPMGNSLFPSYILATAAMKKAPVISASETETTAKPRHVGDWRELVGVAFQPVREDTKLRIEITGSHFLRTTTYETRLAIPGFVYHIFPPLDFDYAGLRDLSQPTPETVTFKVSDISNEEEGRVDTETETETVTFHALSDCPLESDGHDLAWILGAYVNENSPIVESLLQEALDAGIVKNFAGYQVDEQGVRDQVFAIWFALQRRGIRYSDVATPSAGADKVPCQTIRPLRDSLAYHQANCVDGSLLFASAFRKIGLRTFLLLSPDHCFVAVFRNPRGGILTVETTLLGADNPLGGRHPSGAATPYEREQARQSFDRAVAFWPQQSPLFSQIVVQNRQQLIQELDSRANELPKFRILDLETMRNDGLNPL